MAWIKPVTEITKKGFLEFVSIYDPELDHDSTPKELITEYYGGNIDKADSFVWKGDKTIFVLRPLTVPEWQEIQLTCSSKVFSKEGLDEMVGLIMLDSLICYEAFKLCFKKVKLGNEEQKRADIIDSIPAEVKKEIGRYCIKVSTTISPLS